MLLEGRESERGCLRSSALIIRLWCIGGSLGLRRSPGLASRKCSAHGKGQQMLPGRSSSLPAPAAGVIQIRASTPGKPWKSCITLPHRALWEGRRDPPFDFRMRRLGCCRLPCCTVVSWDPRVLSPGGWEGIERQHVSNLCDRGTAPRLLRSAELSWEPSAAWRCLELFLAPWTGCYTVSSHLRHRQGGTYVLSLGSYKT